MKKLLKKIIAVLLSFLIVAIPLTINLENYIVLETSAAELTTNETKSKQSLYCDNANIYVADCISKGICDPYTGVSSGSIKDISMSISHEYTYKLIAKELNDDKILAFNSVFWKNIQNVLDGNFLEATNWQVQLYTVLIIDYLNYYSQSNEFKSNFIKINNNFANELYDALLPIVKDDLIENMSLSEAIEYSKKMGFTYKLEKYSNLKNDIGTVSTTALEYYKHLTKALSVQQANKSRMDFLKAMKIAGKDDYYFTVAVDNVVSMYESSYAELALAESAYTMLDYSMDVLFKKAKEACPALKQIIDGLKLYNSGLNWLFNSDDLSDNNLKLMILYIMDSYAMSALLNLRDEYWNNSTKENATTLVNGYLCYLKYEEYASNATTGFVSSILFDGMWNQIKNIFSDKNQMTYNEFKGYFQNDIDFCKRLNSLTVQYYDLYNDLLEYDSGIFVSSNSIKVNLVKFVDDECELFSNYGVIIPAQTFPRNADYGSGIRRYYSSDTSIITVEEKTGKTTPVSEGTAYICAESNNGVVGKCKITVLPFYAKNINNQYEITRYIGENSSCVVPSTVDGVPVTSIGCNAFYSKKITRVTLPNGIIEIKEGAFYECKKLENINIPNTVTNIGDYAFAVCSMLTNISMPNSVKSIGNYAFSYCSTLKNITIPNSVTSIGECAFVKCSELTNVTIPNSINSLGDYAFAGCRGLTNVTIPNTLTRINEGVFSHCSSLTSVIIPNSVTNISDFAFAECSSLTDVVMRNSVTSINEGVFANCRSLTSITIPNSVTSISDFAFAECSSLTDVVIPNSVTSIGNYAFYNCSKLTGTIEIPKSVKCIGEYAFRGTNPTKMILPFIGNSRGGDTRSNENSMYYIFSGASSNPQSDIPTTLKEVEITDETVVAPYAFQYCDNVTKIKLNEGITKLFDHAFYNCKGLTSITIPNSVTSIGDSAFSDCSGLTSITIPNSVTSIGGSAFLGCSGLTGVTIPNSVTEIEASVFAGCSELKSVTIPDSVISIGNHAFSGCTQLTSITIPNSVTNIGDYAFQDCIRLTSISIPDGVTSISEGTFFRCSGLKSVKISENVTSIGLLAFSECSGLTEVTMANNVKIIGVCAFFMCSSLTSITIPKGVTSIGDYAFGKCSGLTSVTIPNSVTSIGASAFGECSGLTSVTIPNSVTSIDMYAFYKCGSLTSVTIPNSVTSIGDNAFYDCKYLTSIDVSSDNKNYSSMEGILFDKTKSQLICYPAGKLSNSYIIPNTVINIKNDAFYKCGSLTSITIPNSVTSIGNAAFYSCSGLTSITIPNSVTSIGYRVFGFCSGLTSVTIPNSVTSIDSLAFDSCSGLTSVTLSNSVKNIKRKAFGDCSNLDKVYYLGDNFSDITIDTEGNDPLLNASLVYLKKGDINIDSNIGLKDVILTLRHAIGSITLNDTELLCADVNNDGEVSLKDAVIIQKYIVGLIENCSAE